MTPEGYIPVADFARAKGPTSEKVINMIRDGFYVGQKVGDDWFVSRAELSGSHKQTGSTSTSTTVANSVESLLGANARRYQGVM